MDRQASACVWVGNVFTPEGSDTPGFKFVWKDRQPPEIGATEFRMRYALAGEPLGPEYFPDAAVLDLDPTEIWPARRYATIVWSSMAKSPAGVTIVRLPDFVHVGRNVVVSRRCVEVMRHFDLGETGFHPIAVFQPDGVTSIGDGWHAMTFANRKEAFAPEQSVNLFKEGRSTWRAMPTIADDQLAVTAQALDGPAVWVDPALRNYLFFSDPLHQALAAENLLDGIRKVVRVRVV